MTSDPHASDAPSADLPHGTNDHAHPGEGDALGPVDVAAWGAGAIGIAIGLVVAVCFAVATGAVG